LAVIGIGLTAGRAPAAQGRGARIVFGSCTWGGGTNCVVDGDTIHVNGAKIRIADIDAPEVHDNYRCAAELALGQRAAVRLRQLLNSGVVTMSRIDRDRDVYGRYLRNVQVDGRDVGAVLVHEGLAHVYRGYKLPWCRD
jgi:endonuclease YncB( thermonuclease family)